MNPIGDGNGPVEAIHDVTKLLCSKALDSIRVTIAAGQKITDDFLRQIANEARMGVAIVVVSRDRHSDQRVVRDGRLSLLKFPSFQDVPVPILDFIVRGQRHDTQAFRQNQLSAVSSRADNQQNRSRIDRLIDQAATDSNRQFF